MRVPFFWDTLYSSVREPALLITSQTSCNSWKSLIGSYIPAPIKDYRYYFNKLLRANTVSSSNCLIYSSVREPAVGSYKIGCPLMDIVQDRSKEVEAQDISVKRGKRGI